MAVKTLNELFEHEMKDIYYAEHRLVEALEKLAGETKSREIKRAYTSHRKETQGQIKRLQKVFKLFGEVPEAEKCPGIEGLLKEQQNFVKKEKPSQEILDYFNLGAASKTERYEITAYESLIEIAQLIGMADAVELLSQNLQEEEAALENLQALSESYNASALVAVEEEEEEEVSSRGGSSAKKGGSKKSAAKGSAKKSGAKKSAAKGSAKKSSSRNADSRTATPRSKGSERSGSSRGAENADAQVGGMSYDGDLMTDEQMMAQTDPATAV